MMGVHSIATGRSSAPQGVLHGKYISGSLVLHAVVVLF